MNKWFSMNMGDGIIAGGTLSHIETVLTAIYTKKKNPNDMAVFTRHDSEGRYIVRLLHTFLQPL